MGVKKEWKMVGIKTGRAFKDLGKAICKSTRVGVDKLDDKVSNNESSEEYALKEDWKNVGHEMGDAGKQIGKAFSTTAKTVFTDEDEKNA